MSASDQIRLVFCGNQVIGSLRHVRRNYSTTTRYVSKAISSFSIISVCTSSLPHLTATGVYARSRHRPSLPARVTASVNAPSSHCMSTMYPPRAQRDMRQAPGQPPDLPL